MTTQSQRKNHWIYSTLLLCSALYVQAGDILLLEGNSIAKLPINTQLAAYGNIHKPEFGPDWPLRFQVQFLFPK